MWIVIIRALISWVNPDPYNPIVRFLHAATDPVLYRIRRLMPSSFGGIDFSPILVIAGLIFLERFLVQSLFDLSPQLQLIVALHHDLALATHFHKAYCSVFTSNPALHSNRVVGLHGEATQDCPDCPTSRGCSQCGPAPLSR